MALSLFIPNYVQSRCFGALIHDLEIQKQDKPRSTHTDSNLRSPEFRRHTLLSSELLIKTIFFNLTNLVLVTQNIIYIYYIMYSNNQFSLWRNLKLKAQNIISKNDKCHLYLIFNPLKEIALVAEIGSWNPSVIIFDKTIIKCSFLFG